MAEIDAADIKRTQETLGKYVKKPVLSEKLLKKPPFRFLHDVFNAVIRETGYFDGLYTADELNYENISDRDAKMNFLQKMIDAIKIITNEKLTVRTSKIVAGHEPEKTNELLQMMGIVIDKKLDWKQAIAQINDVESPLSKKQKPKEKEKDKEKDSKEKKSTDRSPKVGATKKSDPIKEKPKVEVKEKIKSKDVKEKSSRKSSKVTETEKKDEKKLKTKLLTKEPSKKVSSKKATIESPIKADTKLDLKPKPESQTEIKKSLEKVEKVDTPNKVEITKIAENLEQVQLPTVTTREEEKIVTPPETLASPSTEFKRDEHRASKRAEEILLTAAAEDNNDGNVSRRSSGSKRSSGRSRRSSGEKSRKPKPDDTQIPSDLNDTLKTVAEEPPTEIVPKPFQKPESRPTSNTNSEVKRESTFVREDSKESTQIPARPRTSLRPPSARPASARPGAPRRRDKNIEIVLQPNDQIKLSGISVRLETFNSELEDDGENLVIIENPNTEDQLQGIMNKDNNAVEDESLHQGHLVQQILETQKELVQASSPDTEQKRDKENDISKLNSRQSSARQMNSLRDVIQNLTKSVNPLGKLMDFIPEDIDAMQLELTMWRDTYNQSSIELKKERSLTESVTEPMKNQLVTIEANIKEYRDMIDGCRAKILQNADKIQRLLTTQ
ncbi:TRAF3-interacting protein 1 [Episyrphus balteatus]|uniref:TRAF3-interacting protein 1 n=1 Tax=Episyrphus balteatus TaxID=286459 RepID=UPI002485FBA0|nr:TRAF3-interacting protein 1 [Episyrphus balteatus]